MWVGVSWERADCDQASCYLGSTVHYGCCDSTSTRNRVPICDFDVPELVSLQLVLLFKGDEAPDAEATEK